MFHQDCTERMGEQKALGEKEPNKHTWEMDEMIQLSFQFSWMDDLVIEFTFVLR